MIILRHRRWRNAARRRTFVRSLRRIDSPCRTGDVTYYPLTDVQGTVWGYADANNSIVARFEYDAWGNILSATSSVPALARNRYRFQGREWSAATGLANFRARWYDPVTGRWLSKDPIGLNGGLNLYACCGNDSINLYDPFGFSRILITDNEGGEKVLRNPSLDDFKDAINGMNNGSIANITIYDHGWINVMHIDGNGSGFSIGWDGCVRFDDADGSSVADLLGPKMAVGGSVVLSGCLTAYEGWFNSSDNNVSKALSSQLPGINVSGNRGFAVGPKIGPTWNIGIRRTYVNGY